MSTNSPGDLSLQLQLGSLSTYSTSILTFTLAFHMCCTIYVHSCGNTTCTSVGDPALPESLNSSFDEGSL